jgi:enamine deaminase RidA (YjgF/YER057c/UK114 family)
VDDLFAELKGHTQDRSVGDAATVIILDTIIERHTVLQTVTLIRSKVLSDKAEYAYAATAPADARLIFLAGSCPLNEDGSTAGIGDYALQAAKCIENMERVLSESGAGITDVISTRVLVASIKQSDLGVAWRVVREAFGDHDVPSTLLGVTVLGYDDQLVEIEAIAAVRN